MTAAAIPAAQPRSSAMVRRAVLSSVIGNGLEWYDFLVYGFFATIIAKIGVPDVEERLLESVEAELSKSVSA